MPPQIFRKLKNQEREKWKEKIGKKQHKSRMFVHLASATNRADYATRLLFLVGDLEIFRAVGEVLKVRISVYLTL